MFNRVTAIISLVFTLLFIILVFNARRASDNIELLDRQLNECRQLIHQQDSLVNTVKLQMDSLNQIHPKPKYRKSGWICPQTFLGFVLWGRVNTRGVSEDLQEALESFSGPKVMITSLRRNWNSHSKHNHGKAVDMEFNHALIVWLTSDEGRDWLDQHNLIFYIEAKPRDKKLDLYKENERFRPYVFENPEATGPHIHLNLV